MNPESCSELYNCSRVKMTPLIRVLLCCTAAEALESICTKCQQKGSRVEHNEDYMAPSGQKVTLVVGEGVGETAKTAVSAR